MRKSIAALFAGSLFFAVGQASAQTTDRCVGGTTPVATGAYIVLFDPQSAELKPRAQREIADIANTARQRYVSHICLDAFADSVPGREADLALARRRADSVRNGLIAGGYPGDKISLRNVIDPKSLNRVTGTETRTERKVEIRFGR